MARQSVRGLAKQLGVPREVLNALADNAPEHYRPFILKARGKKPRQIDNPAEALKHVQRRIRMHILKPIALPAHVTGCVPGMSAQKNAELHLGARFITSVDIKNFYPSITNARVFQLWLRLGFAPRLASLLTKLTTVNGHLPQGAPTSDALANHAVSELDKDVASIASTLGLRFTRYLDNIDLSGDRAPEALAPTVAAVLKAGFSVRHKKVFTAGRWTRQVVTGFNSGRSRVSLPLDHQRRIRAAVHGLLENRAKGTALDKDERSVAGRLRFLRVTHPGAADRLHHVWVDAGIKALW